MDQLMRIPLERSSLTAKEDWLLRSSGIHNQDDRLFTVYEQNFGEFFIGRYNYMKNDNSKKAYDSYLEPLERIKKSLEPLVKTLSEMTLDTSVLTGAVGLMSNRIAEVVHGYENVDISKSVSAALKASYTPLEVSESYKQSMEAFKEIGRQFSAINMAEEYRRSLDSLQNIAKSLISVSTIDTARSIQNLQESMKIFTDSVVTEQISQLESIDYGKVFSQALEKNGTFKDAVDAAYESLKEEDNTLENVELETDFANEQEIQDTINDQMNNPVGFQERVANWAAEKYKKYFIVINFWLFIWGTFIQPYLQENVGLPVMTYAVSNVKELPEKGAKIVAQLKKNIEATIIENTSYYYKIIFEDENGIQRDGYVAKRNLKIIEEPETEEMEEESDSSSSE